MAAAVVLLLLGGLGIALWNRHSPAVGADDVPGLLPGVGGLGDGPGTSTGGSAPPGRSHSSGGVQPSGSASVGPSAVPPSTDPSGSPLPSDGPVSALRVTSSTTSSLLKLSAVITVHNDGVDLVSWNSVGVVLSGLNLMVDNDNTVNHQFRSPVHCYYPTVPVASIAAGGAFTFTITVTGTAGTLSAGVKSLSINSADCA